MAIIFQPNTKGIRELLRLPSVEADLRRRAEAVARAASGSDDLTYNVHSEIGKNRARAAVVTGDAKAAAVEARDHRLARSIDAARR